MIEDLQVQVVEQSDHIRQLYDLRVDPQETSNLAQQPAQQENVAELSSQLR